MAEIRINFNKGLRMDYACANDELRPVMNCIHFENGYAYASDGHILVRNKLSECSSISNEQIELLNGKNLHSQAYRELLKYDVIEISEDGIEATKSGEKSFYYFSNIEDKYPNAEDLLQEALNATPVPITQIGLNTTLLIILNKSLHESTSCKYQFAGASSPIILQSMEWSSVGLIMPSMIRE